MQIMTKKVKKIYSTSKSYHSLCINSIKILHNDYITMWKPIQAGTDYSSWCNGRAVTGHSCKMSLDKLFTP